MIVHHKAKVQLDQDGLYELDIQTNYHRVRDARVIPGPGTVAIVEADADQGTRLILAYGTAGQSVELCWTVEVSTELLPDGTTKLRHGTITSWHYERSGTDGER